MTGGAMETTALLRLLPGRPLIAASVKVSLSGISDGRRLYTLPRAAFAPQASRRFLTIAEAFLGHDASTLRPWLEHCEMVHFGLDPDPGANGLPLRKVYLELTGDTPDDPALTYLALKAGTCDMRLNRYVTVPMATEAQADALLASLALAARFQPLAQNLTRAIITGLTDCPTLLVTEDGTTRRSLDFNFADEAASDNVLAALAALLSGLGQTTTAIERLLAHPLCHAALGVAANGAPFVTLYGFPEDSED
jgi:hypothetical protein